MEGLRSKNHQTSTSQNVHTHHLKVLNVHYDTHGVHLQSRRKSQAIKKWQGGLEME